MSRRAYATKVGSGFGLNERRTKVLVLAGHDPLNASVVAALKNCCDVAEAAGMDQAIEALRNDHFSAVFSDAADFLPLERALISQQANLILCGSENSEYLKSVGLLIAAKVLING